METITIFLPVADVEKFKLFQKYYDIFSKLENEGVFKMNFGKCTLNIAFGQIQNIVREEMIYKK